MGFIEDFKEWSNLKKVASLLVVCFIGIIIVAMIGGGLSPDQNTQTNTNNSGSTSDASGVQVKVIYDGEWSGAITTGDTSNSVSGSGEDTIDVNTTSFGVVSANAQKMDGGDGKLTIQIIKDGKVAKESSTTTEYGVASVTS